MKKKKLLLGLLLAAGAISFASCAKKANNSTNQDTTILESKEENTTPETKDDNTISTTETNIVTPVKTEYKVTYEDPTTGKSVVIETKDGKITGLPIQSDYVKKEYPFAYDYTFIGWHVVGTEDEFLENGDSIKKDVTLEADYYAQRKMDTDLDLSDVTDYKDEIAEIMVLDESYLVGFLEYDDYYEYSYIYIKENGKFKAQQPSYDYILFSSSFSSITDDDDKGELSLANSIDLYSDYDNFQLLYSSKGFELSFIADSTKYIYHFNNEGYLEELATYDYDSLTGISEYEHSTFYDYIFETPATDEEIEKIADNSLTADEIICEEYVDGKYNKYIFTQSQQGYNASYYTTIEAPQFNFEGIMPYYFEYDIDSFYMGSDYVKLYTDGGYIIFNLDGSIRIIKNGKRTLTIQYKYNDDIDEESSIEVIVKSIDYSIHVRSFECDWTQNEKSGSFEAYVIDDKILTEGELFECSYNINDIVASGVPGLISFLSDHEVLAKAVVSKNLNSYIIEAAFGDYSYRFEVNNLGQIKKIIYYDSYTNQTTTIDIIPSIKQYAKVIVRPNIGDNYSETIQAFGEALHFDLIPDTYDIENKKITRAIYKNFDTFRPIENGITIDKETITVLVNYETIDGVLINIYNNYNDPEDKTTILLSKDKTYGEELKYVNTNISGFMFDGWYLDSEYKTKVDMESKYNEGDTLYLKYIPLTK